jgi:hypothetical protein
LDVRQPSRLETRNSAEILLGISTGAWQEPVNRLRSLAPDTDAQRQAKLALPFCTWAGVFSRRANDGLLNHSGQVGIDLDDLGEAGAVAVIQAAVADVHCFAAFRSARGEGVRLVFRIPPCTPEQHAAAFEQVALHVRNIYRHEPDRSGSDVARASFVSFDRGLWVNYGAEVLPLKLSLRHSASERQYRCVASSVYAGQLAETWPSWYGRNSVAALKRPDGTAATHGSLLALGKSLAIHAERIKTKLTPRHLDAAFAAWLNEYQSQGASLRCNSETYRRELRDSVAGAQSKTWFRAVVDKWLRWKRHADFPHTARPHAKVSFAIRQHCAEQGSPEFFLSVRDASLVADIGKDTGARVLRALVKDGHLEKVGERRRPRHAQSYRLLK